MNKKFTCKQFQKLAIILFIITGFLVFIIGNDMNVFFTSLLKIAIFFSMVTYYYCRKNKN